MISLLLHALTGACEVAALARAEMERLRMAGVKERAAAPVTLLDLLRSAAGAGDYDAVHATWETQEEQRLADILGPEKYAEYRRSIDERAARRRWHDEERRLYHPRERPLRAEVEAWTASLRVGDRVRTLHDLGAYDGPPLPSEILTLARRTPAGILVMADGSKWRTDGYKRGETGREGYRTFIVPAEPAR